MSLDALSGVSMALRAPSFAAATVGLSTFGHVLAGGGPPDPALLGLLLVLVGVTFSAVARREQTLPRLLLAVGVTQLSLHQLLATAGHTHRSLAVAMVVAHALAGAAVAWWLRRGEAAAWRLARRVVRSLIPTSPTPLPEPVPTSVRTGRAAPAPPPWLIAMVADPRRGPPHPA
jgi:hypothetical protein